MYFRKRFRNSSSSCAAMHTSMISFRRASDRSSVATMSTVHATERRLEERARQLAPVGAHGALVARDELNADVVGARVAHQLHTRLDCVEVTPCDDRVDQPVAAPAGEVVVLVAEAPQVVRV